MTTFVISALRDPAIYAAYHTVTLRIGTMLSWEGGKCHVYKKFKEDDDEGNASSHLSSARADELSTTTRRSRVSRAVARESTWTELDDRERQSSAWWAGGSNFFAE